MVLRVHLHGNAGICFRNVRNLALKMQISALEVQNGAPLAIILQLEYFQVQRFLCILITNSLLFRMQKFLHSEFALTCKLTFQIQKAYWSKVVMYGKIIFRRA